GHHLFDAADGAFSAHLTGMETADLRRWILGAEGGRRSRGLKKRIEDLARENEKAQKSLSEVLRAARVLPGTGWRQRLADDEPLGPLEAFLARLRVQVRAREAGPPNRYSLECEARPHGPGLIEAAGALEIALADLLKPVGDLYRALGDLLDDETAELNGVSRSRIEAVRRGLNRRGRRQIEAWRSMLRDLGEETPPEFVDWFGIDRLDGRDLDVGFHRHWTDPTRPFAEAVLKPAHGVLVTSATLKDGVEDDDWVSAEERSGAAHLASDPVRASLPSPFDYAGRTRIFVVGDVDKNDPAQVGSAMRELFLAAGGGGLGLFTAITRLRAVHKRIAGPLEEGGLSLLAQHVDAMDTGTLIDLFRAEEDSCLLGTDAVRDGVDIPGRSLRLIVFDRVPWPRPDILHKARRAAFGGRAYDEMLTRRKLKQAYGRLIRRFDDRGVFVMLDRGLPTRLTGAFPAGVDVRRLGIADVVSETRAFLDHQD
ncbi:MAG TPA: ATP-dependent DNA helicase, partial [Rhodospirillales bacterium]|nr:ATP-dependent DNA helicase [Rhodospirillales bacterium]